VKIPFRGAGKEIVESPLTSSAIKPAPIESAAGGSRLNPSLLTGLTVRVSRPLPLPGRVPGRGTLGRRLHQTLEDLVVVAASTAPAATLALALVDVRVRPS